MTKLKQYTVVIVRLLFAALLHVIRWAIFQPLAFIGLIVSTVGETGLNGLQMAINTIQQRNNELLNPIEQQPKR